MIEPRLKTDGITWDDVVPSLEAITVDILKQCAESGSIEPIMAELSEASGPLALKISVLSAKRSLVRSNSNPDLRQETGADWGGPGGDGALTEHRGKEVKSTSPKSLRMMMREALTQKLQREAEGARAVAEAENVQVFKSLSTRLPSNKGAQASRGLRRTGSFCDLQSGLR